jgi:hypothetical protein
LLALTLAALLQTSDGSFWDRLWDELRSLGETLAEWVVLIAIALIVLVVGRFILIWIRRIIQGVLGVSWLDPVWNRSGINTALEDTDQTAASIAATIAYYYLWVVLWLIVTRILRLTSIEVLLERLLAFIPLVILAAIAVVVFAAAGSWAAELIKPFADESGVPWLVWVVRVGVIVFGVLLALDILDIRFAENIILLVVAAIAVALAIAFGVGGIDAGKQWWSRHGTPSAMDEQRKSGM